jgi:hypothetical protein
VSPMPPDLAERQRKRFVLLNAIFDAVDGRTGVRLKGLGPFCAALGFETEEAWHALGYLQKEGLIEFWGPLVPDRGAFALTHPGLLEVEAARTRPEQPTSHFEAGIFAHIGSVGAGAIVQVGPGNMASIQAPRELGDAERAAITRALEALATAAASANADDVVAEIGVARTRVEDRSLNGARVFSVLVGLATLVQAVPNVQPAYNTFKAALAVVGIQLP